MNKIKTGLFATIFVLMVIFISRVDFQLVFAYIRSLGVAIIAIIMATFGAYMLATRAWQICLGSDHKFRTSIWDLFAIRQIGEALTLINPTNIIAGEASKVYMLGSFGIRRNKATHSIIISRLLIITSYLMLTAFSLSVLFTQSFENSNLKIVLVVLISGLIAAQLFSFRVATGRLSISKIISPIIYLIPSSGLKDKLIKGINNVQILLDDDHRKKKHILICAFIFSMLHWILGTFEFFIILNGLDIQSTFLDAMVLEAGVMFFKSIGGFIPGQLGIEEYGNKLMLGFLGIPSLEIWMAVSILRRARQIFWLVLGILLLVVISKKYNWKFYS